MCDFTRDKLDSADLSDVIMIEVAAAIRGVKLTRELVKVEIWLHNFYSFYSRPGAEKLKVNLSNLHINKKIF